MTSSDDWTLLKPDTELAVGKLLEQLRSETSGQDLLDAYLFAKKLLAESMQAFIRIGLEEPDQTFRDLREKLGEEIHRRYRRHIPERYLRVPYGSSVHEQLFKLLLQRQGQPVQADLLRIVTADSVHTERRVRELRELGLDIRSSEESGQNLYTLGSLTIDTSFIPSIVRNVVKKDSGLTAKERQSLLGLIGS